ncbi:hypothetical protein [Actinoplanes sp. NPDC049681]
MALLRSSLGPKTERSTKHGGFAAKEYPLRSSPGPEAGRSARRLIDVPL